MFKGFSKVVLMLVCVVVATGCASPDYAQYLAAQNASVIAKSKADEARYNALASIAKTDGTAAIAAVMALSMNNGNLQQNAIAPPQPNQALQWASILVPAIGQAYAIGKNADVSIAASSNAVKSAEVMTTGFVNIAGKIQAPVVAAPVVAGATTTTSTTDNHTQTLSGTGTLGSGAYTSSADMLTGTGTLGSGAYSTTDNHATSPIVVPPVVQIVPTVITPITPTVPVIITP